MSQPSDTDLDRWLAEHGPRWAPRFAMLEPRLDLVRRLRERGASFETLHRAEVTVGAGATHDAFSLPDRQRLRNWQRRLHASIDSAGDLLLPVPATATPTNPAIEPKGGSHA